MPQPAVSQELSDTIKLWAERPDIMVMDLFGHLLPNGLDPWQTQVLQDFPSNPRQVMLACKGPGKTAVLAWLCWNFLLTRPHPKIKALSITGKNLADNLWPEMAKWKKASPLLEDQFEWRSERIFLKAHPETWFMTAASWPQTTNEQELGSTLAGLWADHVMFVLDECGSIPVAVMRTAEAVMGQSAVQGREAHIVMAGNTTSNEGCLYDAAITHRQQWKVYEITADPDDPNRTTRISADYARDQISLYGRDNPWVMINILAKFPSQGVNQMISADQVRECIGKHIHVKEYNWAPKILGGDVADFGDDKTVLFPRQGTAYLSPLVLRKMDPVQIAGNWMQFATRYGADSIQVDATGGYGAGPIAIMKDQGYTVMPVQFSGEALNPKFFNKRAEIWWNACEHLKQGASLPTQYIDATAMHHDLNELIAELSSATYSYKGDRIIIEDKKLMKARLGRSPDYADALCCTHAYPVSTPLRTSQQFGGFDIAASVSRTKHDYDPLTRD